VGYNFWDVLFNIWGAVSNCYATGTVSGIYYYVGGLVGRNYGPVSNSYATGTVSGTDFVGGLVGYNIGSPVFNSFWDIQTSGTDVSYGGTGLPTSQMKTKATFTSAGWDFDGIWWMIEYATYPLLSIQDFTLPTVGIQSPVSEDMLATTNVTVGWVGDDAHSGIKHFEVRINESVWQNLGKATQHTFEGVDEGVHTVDVMVFDHFGNSATDSVTFTVDVTPPMVGITSPHGGVELTDNDVTVQWSGSDGGSGIDRYQVRLNYGGWNDDPDQDTEFTYYGLNDGNHRVDVRVFDKAGNTAVDGITFTLDLAGPLVIWNNETVWVNQTIPEYHNTTVWNNQTIPEYHNTTVPVYHNTTVTEYHNTTVPEYHNSTVWNNETVTQTLTETPAWAWAAVIAAVALGAVAVAMAMRKPGGKKPEDVPGPEPNAGPHPDEPKEG
jgi:hypothetical protein